MQNNIRILLVDDHAVVREGLRALLEEHDDVCIVGECANGDEAVANAPGLNPDVVLIDLKMPGLPVAASIRGIRDQLPDARVLVFTSFADERQMRETLDAGAIGFLLKEAPGDELIAVVRAVARGEPRLHLQQHQLDRLLQPSTQSPLHRLTGRERDVLLLLGEGLSNKQIGSRLSLTEGTVKGYVSNVLAKLDLGDRTHAALFAQRNFPPGDT